MPSRQLLRWLGTAVCDAAGAPCTSQARLSLVRVYAQDIPALLSFNRRLMLFIAGLFFIGVAGGVALAELFPSATETLLRAYAAQIERLGGADSISTAAIMRNNLRIMLLSPVLAVFTVGLYPLIVATLPGILLGMLAVQIETMAPLKVLIGLLLVAPHGVFEIPAILFGSALSMRLAWSLFRPVTSLSATENVVWAAANVVKGYVFLVIPLLVTAAWIEVNVTGRIARWIIGLNAILAVPQP